MGPAAPLTSNDIRSAVGRVVQAHAEAAAGRVVAVYLFGSFARHQQTAESDVDLGLLFAAPPAGTLLAQPFLLEADLGRELGRQVQCVVMNSAPVDLVQRILAAKTLLFDLNPSLRIRFEVGARNRYFDLKPILDRYREPGHVA